MPTPKPAARWTPGPWRVSSLVPWYIIPGDDAMPVCSLAEFNEDGIVEHIFPDDDVAQAKANARLIAAAPELAEALRDIKTTLALMAPGPEEVLNQIHARAESILAKLDGVR